MRRSTARIDPPASFPQSYWVLPAAFLAGEYPASLDPDQTRRKLLGLLRAGLDTFIDLTDPSELPSYLAILQDAALSLSVKFTYQRFPIPDGGTSDRPNMLAVLDSIDEALAAGRHVYLHCWGGVGRTGTTVACFLIRHGRTPQEALDQLALWWRDMPKRQLHPHSPETDQQVRFVLEWLEPQIASRQPPNRGGSRPV